MSDLYATIGANVRAARKAVGMSQTDLATAISHSRTSIANLEVGRQHPPLHTLVTIAAVLGVAPGALLPADWWPKGASLAAQQAEERLRDVRAMLIEIVEELDG